MRRLGIALLMALFVGLAPFMLGNGTAALLTALIAPAVIFFLIRRLIGEPPVRDYD